MTSKRPMARRMYTEAGLDFATERQMGYIHFLMSVLGYRPGRAVPAMRKGPAGAMIGQLTKFIDERIARNGFIVCPNCEKPHPSLKDLKDCCPPGSERADTIRLSRVDLDKVRKEARADLIRKISKGEEIDGQTLPPNPMRVLVVGKSVDHLQARVIYRNIAPYYFNVRREA